MKLEGKETQKKLTGGKESKDLGPAVLERYAD